MKEYRNMASKLPFFGISGVNPRIDFYINLKDDSEAFALVEDFIEKRLSMLSQQKFKPSDKYKDSFMCQFIKEFADEMDAFFVSLGFREEWVELVSKETKEKSFFIISENDRIAHYKNIREDKAKINEARYKLLQLINKFKGTFEVYLKEIGSEWTDLVINKEKAKPSDKIKPSLEFILNITKEIDALFVSLGYKELWYKFVKYERK